MRVYTVLQRLLDLMGKCSTNRVRFWCCRMKGLQGLYFSH